MVKQLLAQWPQSAQWSELQERLKATGQITSLQETAYIYQLISHLKPKYCLEIGSFFGATTRIMAQASVDTGSATKVITIDPFGQERMPGIMASWPEALQKIVKFMPVSSMDFFIDLAKASPGSSIDAPIGLAFIDGNHNFEYALFDILSCANHLQPGGVMVVDNMMQQGPKNAVMRFLEWNPAWILFCGETFYDSTSVDSLRTAQVTPWGVLLAPEGIQIASQPFKLIKNVDYKPLRSLKLSIREVNHGGVVRGNFRYCAIPFDFHLTGTGIIKQRARIEQAIEPGSQEFQWSFNEPLELDLTRPDMNIRYQLELSLYHPQKDAFLLLDANEPVTLA